MFLHFLSQICEYIFYKLPVSLTIKWPTEGVISENLKVKECTAIISPVYMDANYKRNECEHGRFVFELTH